MQSDRFERVFINNDGMWKLEAIPNGLSRNTGWLNLDEINGDAP
jgi:hypothetical protein